jgi:hypothetical protein
MVRGRVARRWFVAGALAVCVGVTRSRAIAEPPRLTVDWSAPAGCPGEAELRAAAERLLGGPIEPRLSHSLVVHGRVTPRDERLVLTLETVDDGIRGERTLIGTTCQELTSAAALILALAVDPKAVAEHSGAPPDAAPSASATGDSAPPTADTPAPVVAVPTAITPLPAPARPERPTRPIHVTARIEAAVVGDVGALPGPSLGPEVSATLGLDRFRLRPFVAYYAPRFAPANDSARPGAHGDVSLLVGGLAGCYAAPLGALELAGCGAMEGGALFAIGVGFDIPREATPLWLAAGGAAEVLVPLAGALVLRVSAGAVAPFGRSPVRFLENTGNLQQIHRPWAVSARAAVGLGFAFW